MVNESEPGGDGAPADKSSEILVEICIDSVQSAIAAQHGGADRLEVCGPLATGGTTPSHGLVRACREQTWLPVMMMIRPHDGGFVYDEDDVKTMLHDIEVAKKLEVQGVVFGALTPDLAIDVLTTARLIEAAKPLQITFHRAFDVSADPMRYVHELINLGVDRILTSGQAATAPEGAALLRTLVEEAAGRLTILAGSGVTAANAASLVSSTGVREIHASASKPQQVTVSNGDVTFGKNRRQTDAKLVRDLVQAVK